MERPILVTFGFPDTNSPRYRNLVKLYEQEGWDIRECLTEKKGFLAKCLDLKTQFNHVRNEYDAVLVNFPGYYLVPLAWWLTRRPRKPLYFDAFISISDTLVSDRKKVSWLNPVAWFYYLADVISCHLPDTVLIDTEAHKRFFVSRFFLKPDSVRVVYVETRTDLFFPGPSKHLLKGDKFNVLFIGSYIPLQGIEHIVEAARILRDETDIHFTLIGNGQTRQQIECQITEHQLQNITLLNFQPIETLPDYLRSCDVALGIFGTSQKADRVIPHKVYDAVACGV
ncbi:glycosyltransferase, partial [Candidatus Kaiserbacteria bacterium]|nr:glycosyltransferase [Candidatus Kaiserbacteria bacterium]